MTVAASTSSQGASFEVKPAGTTCKLHQLLSYGWGKVPLWVCFQKCLAEPTCTHFSWLEHHWCHTFSGCTFIESTTWRKDDATIYQLLRQQGNQTEAGNATPSTQVVLQAWNTTTPALETPIAPVAQDPGTTPAPPILEDSCWRGIYTAEICCDPRHGPEGLSRCWDGDFNHERCCRGAQPWRPQAIGCWDRLESEQLGGTSMTAEHCCNTQNGPKGNLMCWDRTFTFEYCCAKYHEERCHPQLSLYSLGLALALALLWLLAALGLMYLRVLDGRDVAQDDHGRLHVLDNAKFLLSVYVVASHLRLMPEANMLFSKVCGDFAEFHTRTFCLVSGIVSQDTCSPKAMRSLVFGVLVPIFLWCTLLQPLLLRRAEGLPWLPAELYGRKVVDNIFHAEASKACWYWFALAAWRLSACPLSALRPWARLLAALVISSLAGYARLGQTWVHYAGEGAFKLNMPLACLPIFVAGQQLPLKWLLTRIPLTWTTMAVGFGLLSSVYAWQTSPDGQQFMSEIPSFGWAYMAAEYCDPPEAAAYLWMRGFFKNVLELSKGLVFLLMCCPRSRRIFTVFGQHSIYPYMLHLAALRRLAPVVQVAPPWSQLLVIPVLLTAVLASWPTRLVFGLFLEPAWLECILARPKLATHSMQRPRG